VTKTVKVCRVCEVERQTSEFYAAKVNADGLRNDCKACFKAASKKTYVANRDQILDKHRQWKTANRDRALAKERERYAGNRESERAKKNARRRANLAKYRAIELAYHKANKQVWADARARRRARLKAAPVVERVYRRKVYERDGGLCYMCRQPVEFADMHLEHKIPLSKGGEHSYANVAVSCEGCNLGKGVKIYPRPSEVCCENRDHPGEAGR